MHTNHPENTVHAGSIQFTILLLFKKKLSTVYCRKNNFKPYFHYYIFFILFFVIHKISPGVFEQFILTLGHYFIVGGNLNATNIDWSCHSNISKVIAFYQVPTKTLYTRTYFYFYF